MKGCSQALGRRQTSAASLALVVVVLSACRMPIDPIVVRPDRVMITNTSTESWRGVEVWVNDHYRVTVATLAPGGVFEAPLSSFVAGFGQRFDVSRQPVRGVEVTARTSDGAAVTLVWGQGRRR